MKIHIATHLALASSLAASLLTLSIASAAIVPGSQVQFSGNAAINAAGDITITSQLPTTVPASIRVQQTGNSGSYLGYNNPNPGGVNYSALMGDIPASGPYGFRLFTLPEVVIGMDETGPALAGTFFNLMTWTIQEATPGGFFSGTGVGVIEDALGTELSGAFFQFSTQNYTPGFDRHSFSATVVASVVPVPGAVLIFGSGLMLMGAVLRRKGA